MPKQRLSSWGSQAPGRAQAQFGSQFFFVHIFDSRLCFRAGGSRTCVTQEPLNPPTSQGFPFLGVLDNSVKPEISLCSAFSIPRATKRSHRSAANQKELFSPHSREGSGHGEHVQAAISAWRSCARPRAPSIGTVYRSRPAALTAPAASQPGTNPAQLIIIQH